MKTLKNFKDEVAKQANYPDFQAIIDDHEYQIAFEVFEAAAELYKSSNVTSLEEEKYLLIHEYADNGEHSHYALIERQTGVKVWSEDPEECKAKGYPVNNSSHTADEELDLLVTRIKYASNDKRVKELITAFKNQSVTSLEERIAKLTEERDKAVDLVDTFKKAIVKSDHLALSLAWDEEPTERMKLMNQIKSLEEEIERLKEKWIYWEKQAVIEHGRVLERDAEIQRLHSITSLQYKEQKQELTEIIAKVHDSKKIWEM
jgi:hypothetical protein